MPNKRIMRLIIYEGPEELVDLYEINAFLGTRGAGIPDGWLRDHSSEERNKIRNIILKREFVKITAQTLPNSALALQEELEEIIRRHENAKI